MWVVYLVVATGFMCSIVTWLRRSRHDAIGVPEGPRGYPILGCFSLLRRYPEQTLHKWAQEYESPYSFTIGNQRIVVISDPKTAKTLFLKNGSICSDRMDTFVKSQTILKGRGITSTTYGHTWRKHRKIAKTSLEPRDVGQQTDVLDAETTKMIRALCRDGENEKHLNPQVSIGRCSLNCMAAITFGSPRICVPDAQVLSLSREFMNTTGPMANLVDFVPVWLQQSLPWGMKRRGKRLHAALVNTYGRQVKRIERDMKNNVHVKDCLVKTMVTRREEEQLDDLDMAMLASAFMVGGVETTASIIQWFSALIPSHEHIQRKAHEELDRVVGRSRLPTLEDKPDLHYCRAIIKEVERCHNPFWLGTPHAASKDLVCNNKLIPAGSVLVLNTWTMHHDPIQFPDPLNFNPDRHLDNSHSSTEPARLKDSRLRDNWTFGIGRRICPGILVAQREIWLAVTKILWAFVLAEVPGHPIDLNEYDGASGRSPVPFKIMLKPRFNEVVEVMAEAEKAWTE